MKSYTDIEQSHVLAGILPIESADMWYCNSDPNKIIVGKWEDDEHDEDDIPCWSLAALIDIINNDYYTNIFHDGATWNINIIHHDTGNKHTTYGNSLIDICYKIILKLY